MSILLGMPTITPAHGPDYEVQENPAYMVDLFRVP